MIVVGVALLLAVIAVLFGVFWEGSAPLTAHVTADDDGKEVVEITCGDCPEGTLLTLEGADDEAEVKDGKAVLPAPDALSVGDNRLRVKIDRPDDGRDETVGITVSVLYRVRVAVDTLSGSKPKLQAVVEAVKGTKVELDGDPVDLVGGRAVQDIDVIKDLTGTASSIERLERTVGYRITPPEGEEDRGEVTASIGIVPLAVDAPGPEIIVDTGSFVLAGKTLAGAEVLAAGKPIAVDEDGTFAQVMNVSSVGSTHIQIRANMKGKAPRLTGVSVERTDDLGAAATKFKQRPKLADYASLRAGVEEHVGKPIALQGEIVDVRHERHYVVGLLDVAGTAGCQKGAGTSPCRVRLVFGYDAKVTSGDKIEAFGQVAGAFVPASGSAVPEVSVAFHRPGAS